MSHFKGAKDGKQRARELFTGGRASSTLKGDYVGAGPTIREDDSPAAIREGATPPVMPPADQVTTSARKKK